MTKTLLVAEFQVFQISSGHRDAYRDYSNSSAGEITWQYEHVSLSILIIFN